MAIFKKRPKPEPPRTDHTWARPEMLVTFRAEIMPCRTKEERTFRIKSVLPNGRVTLYDFPYEHRQGAFEPIKFQRNVSKAQKDQNT